MMATSITSSTRLLAVIGHPVRHSLSPLMHNAAFQRLGLDLLYVALDVEPEALSTAVSGMKALGFLGFNVTIPHKKSIMGVLDQIDPQAIDLGAVNTVVIRDGTAVGYNTDSSGLLMALKIRADFLPAGKSALILGAGGAAWACAIGLAQAGLTRLVVVNRSIEKARALCEEVKARFPRCETSCVAKADLVTVQAWEDLLSQVNLFINATPLGMEMHGSVNEPPLPLETRFPKRLVVCDMVYRPYPGLLINAARAQECPTVDGLDMLLYQGVLAFELFTGQKAPVEDMERALWSAVGGITC